MRLTALKHVAKLQYGDALPSETRLDGHVHVYGSNGSTGFHNKANTLGPAIIVGRKGSFGKVTWSPEPGFCIDTAYFIDSTSTKENLRWLYWVLQTLGLDTISEDTGVPGLSRATAYEAKIHLADHATQTAIADYLDRKTAAIDALIAKKELLIEELRKYQEAVIAETVGAIRTTDPLVKLKRLFKERSERGFANEPPLAATQHAGVVPKASLSFKTMESRSEDYSTYKLVCPDDFVISLRSFEGGLEISKYRGVVSPAYTVLEPGELVHPDYFKYALKSKYFVDSLGVHKRGIRDGQSVPWNALGEDEIRVPTVEAQKNIAAHLAVQVSCFSATVAAVESLVAELKAYRASLISEAVTGKISI